jgi:hypothetical protein
MGFKGQCFRSGRNQSCPKEEFAYGILATLKMSVSSQIRERRIVTVRKQSDKVMDWSPDISLR